MLTAHLSVGQNSTQCHVLCMSPCCVFIWLCRKTTESNSKLLCALVLVPLSALGSRARPVALFCHQFYLCTYFSFTRLLLCAEIRN